MEGTCFLKPKAADVEKLKTMAPVTDDVEPHTIAVTVDATVEDSDEDDDPEPAPTPIHTPAPALAPTQVQEEPASSDEPKKKRILKKKV